MENRQNCCIASAERPADTDFLAVDLKIQIFRTTVVAAVLPELVEGVWPPSFQPVIAMQEDARASRPVLKKPRKTRGPELFYATTLPAG
jgi:hypothetical protein